MPNFFVYTVCRMNGRDAHETNFLRPVVRSGAAADGLRAKDGSTGRSCGGLLCHTLRFADGADTVTRTRVAWRDGAFSVSYTDTYAVTSLTLDGGRLTYIYDMPDNPPGTNHDGHIDTQKTFTIA